MAEQIAPGIYRLKIPLPHKDLLLGYVNIYLIKGRDGYTLVDTGWGTAQAFESVRQELAAVGAELKQIKLVIATHIHPDHFGLSAMFKDVSGARIALHRMDADMVGDRYITVETLMKSLGGWLRINGVPETRLEKIQNASLGAIEWVKPAVPDWLLEGGELIDTGDFHLKVLHTPGHSQGHICVYVTEEKLLLSGDHILPTISSHIGLHPQAAKNPLGDFLASLRMLEKLDVRLVLSGHENPCGNLRGRIGELIRHHDERKANISAQIKTTAKTAFDIATKIDWLSDTNGVGFERLSSWDKRLAILETLSHLECMRFDGEVNKETRDGLVFYRAV